MIRSCSRRRSSKLKLLLNLKECCCLEDEDAEENAKDAMLKSSKLVSQPLDLI